MTSESRHERWFCHFCLMLSQVKLYTAVEIEPYLRIQSLQRQLLVFSFSNLLVVALIGVVLRIAPLLQVAPFNYGFLLHGHSHFAFGGWIFPMLIWLIMNYFPALSSTISFTHWRNVVVLSLTAAYGMLITFPLEGYAAVSIFFSTLSLVANGYLAVIIWKATSLSKQPYSIRLLRASLFYAMLSSLGPFATGPIAALGASNTPLYQDAIYFYLHFQYNGWFSFALLAILYAVLENGHQPKHGSSVYRYFQMACIPSFCLSILWHQPTGIFYVIGGLAAIVQLAGLVCLWKDLRPAIFKSSLANRLKDLSFIALVTKLVLQCISAWPAVALLAFHQRNLIIAYLHLVLLGFATVMIFALVIAGIELKTSRILNYSAVLFVAGFAGIEILLVLSGLNLIVYGSQLLLIAFSILVVLAVTLGISAGLRSRWEST